MTTSDPARGPRLGRAFAALAAGTLLVSSAASGVQFLDDFDLEYTIESRGFDVGVIRFELERLDGNRYRLSSRAQPDGLFAKILSDREASDAMIFELDGDRWTMIDYRQERRGSKAGVTTVTRDGESYELKLDDELKDNVTGNGILEPEFFPLAALVHGEYELAEKNVLLIRRNRFSPHRYQGDGEESVTVNDVNYHAAVFRRFDEAKPEREFRVWIDTWTGFPVKIVRSRGQSLTTLRLKPETAGGSEAGRSSE